MPLPPLLQLPDEAAYRQHFVGTYCRGVIETHDGIRVFFRQNQFDHAFYESTNRDRALRANFITCFQANNSVAKIRTSPLWTREACLNALR